MTYEKFFLVPPMGEALDAARIVNWNVQPGQTFAAGDILLEIETDKSIIEVPADEGGKLIAQLIAKGESLDMETPVGKIEVEGDAPLASASLDAARSVAPAARSAEIAAVPATEPPDITRTRSQETDRVLMGRRRFVTPAARQLARVRGIGLGAIPGTGPHERVTKTDVLAALQRGVPTRVDAHRHDGAGASPAGVEELDIATTHGTLHARRWRSATATPVPTVVLLHGVFGDIDTWAGTIASAARAGLNVAAVDLPCHGRSSASATRFADVVDAVAQAVGTLCDGAIALVGHSLGAAVAVKIATRLGPCISSLTLFAPAGLGTEIDQSFLDGMLYARSNDVLAREISKLTAARVVPSATFLTELRQQLAARSEALAELCREVSWHGVQQIDVLPDLEALSCPVTIVHGRADAIIPWQHALNAPPRVALHLVPQAGHMPQAEAMALACDIVERSAAQPRRQ